MLNLLRSHLIVNHTKNVPIKDMTFLTIVMSKECTVDIPAEVIKYVEYPLIAEPHHACTTHA